MEKRGLSFKQTEKFFEWLQKTLRSNIYDESEYLENVFAQYCNTGNPCYEISWCYTKTGNPEVYNYEIEETALDDDTFNTIITF